MEGLATTATAEGEVGRETERGWRGCLGLPSTPIAARSLVRDLHRPRTAREFVFSSQPGYYDETLAVQASLDPGSEGG